MAGQTNSGSFAARVPHTPAGAVKPGETFSGEFTAQPKNIRVKARLLEQYEAVGVVAKW